MNSKVENFTEATNNVSSSTESDHCDHLESSDIQSEIENFDSFPQTPYNRFMDICDDA